MFRGKLSAKAIRELAAGDRTKPVAIPDVLKPRVWQHVALILDRGISRVFLDGKSAP
jgi:hypothetical protein